MSNSPRPHGRSRFSGAVGSGTSSGLKPGPSSVMRTWNRSGCSPPATRTLFSWSIWLPCLMALTRASSTAILMANASCSANAVLTRASISSCTRRASSRSDRIRYSNSRAGSGMVGEFRGPGSEFRVVGRHGERARNSKLGTRNSEGLEGRLLVRQDGEQLIQLGDLEHLPDLLGDVAQDQLAADRLDLAVERDQFAEC